MKKTGLCIVYANYNYGSILQSYATLLKLRSMGREYEIIRYKRKKNIRFFFNSILRLINKDMRYAKLCILKRKLGLRKNKEFKKNDDIRKRKFDEFIKNNFDNFSEIITDYKKLSEYSKKFDTVLVGSDQLWVPSGLGTNFYNLMFVPEEINKVSYSASFGVSKIPFYQIGRTRKYLKRIQHLSVREKSGQKIIKELTGINADVILDPTLIVSKSDWDKNIKKEKIVDGDYIFCYFLGNNPEQRVEVEKLAKEKGLKIVTMKHLDEYIKSDEAFGDISLYDVGPAEFVNLIRNAKYVCTDSFHGSVFSIIYHKQFISFNRYKTNSKNSRNSRLDSLFGQLGIERRFSKDIVVEIDKKIDYDDVEKKLETLRLKSCNFIEEALSNKN